MLHVQSAKRGLLGAVLAVTLGLTLLAGCTPQVRPTMAPTGQTSLNARPDFEPFDIGEPGDYEKKLVGIDLAPVQEQYRKALELMDSGDLERAEAELITLTSEMPKLSEPFVTLGLLAQRSGDDTLALERARQWYERALKANRREDRAHHQLAVLARKSGDFKLAERHYQAAMAIRPDKAVYHRNAGILYDIYLGQLLVALQEYETFLKLNGEDEQVQLWIVDLKNRIGAQS